MPNSQGTSFIPQRPTKGPSKQRGVRKIYILSFLSYVMFFGALLAAGATLFIKLSLETELTQQQQLLDQERSRFSESEIASVRELAKRIETTKARMNQHISVLSIFESLELSAIQTLNFTGFNYERLNDEATLVTILGQAEKFDSVLFQREVLALNPILSGSSFTEVGLQSREDEAGRLDKMITFSFEKKVDPTDAAYLPRTSPVVRQATVPVLSEAVDSSEIQ
jgi:hypothetical protein